MIRFLTAGESHGKALIGIIEGIPSGLGILKSEIQSELIRRKQGYGRGDRQKIETEELEILSGVRAGKTLGSPIAIQIPNQDWKNWQEIMSVESESQEGKIDVPRPGHADYAGAVKYRHFDMRNVLERASARETAMRVAIATIARKFLFDLGVQITNCVIEIGGEKDSSKWNDLIDLARKEGNTLGGIFEVCATGHIMGLGSYVQWDRRIEGNIAKAFMSLNAIKGVEIGLGFETARLMGSEVHDEFILREQGVGYRSNNSGGVNGGITIGEPLTVRAAMKPLSTLRKPLSSISLKTKEKIEAHYERSDVCAVWSAAVIGESLLALVLADEYLTKFGGDSMTEIKERVFEWKKKAEKIFF